MRLHSISWYYTHFRTSAVKYRKEGMENALFVCKVWRSFLFFIFPYAKYEKASLFSIFPKDRKLIFQLFVGLWNLFRLPSPLTTKRDHNADFRYDPFFRNKIRIFHNQLPEIRQSYDRHFPYISSVILISVPAIQINWLFIAFQPGTDCLPFLYPSLIIGMHSNTVSIRCICFIRFYTEGSNHCIICQKHIST